MTAERTLTRTVVLLAALCAHGSTALSNRPASSLAASRARRVSSCRRAFLGLVPSGIALSTLGLPSPATALVKGSTPPPKAAKREKRTCSSVDECQAIGDARADELFSEFDDAQIKRTTYGDRYVDLTKGSGKVVGDKSVARVRYRVLRLGKRARDGLSGEGSPVFSKGYGEDDDKVGDTVDLPIGSGQVIAALDAGLRGMGAGGRRRINVRPDRGWKLPDAQCLTTYTDVTIVPTTKVQENDACFDERSLPTPSNFADKRRMFRRYDETLIVDVELVDVI